jgi:hypothetical protein
MPSGASRDFITGSARIDAHSSSTPVFFESHFVLHPKARDSAMGTGLPARSASIASFA